MMAKSLSVPVKTVKITFINCNYTYLWLLLQLFGIPNSYAEQLYQLYQLWYFFLKKKSVQSDKSKGVDKMLHIFLLKNYCY